ncbi:MAG: thiamine pyrophosphate-dependent dehydrogenase E1 component subunit alpha [Candidatus Bathyarchaeota archaeon]|nr:MAG: thiamine pyrophosphate-dependent dehydrogenase E1 component subunit alpha [Candidatus Bathyarchaeota archaeon]
MSDLVIDGETKLSLYRTMLRIRAFENGVRRLIKEGHLPARFGLYTGQEAVAAGVCAHLTSDDQIGSTHRPLGHLVAKGCDLKRLLAELCGKRTGFNRGKAGPYHAFDPASGSLGANGIVGGSVPMVAGYALAHQLRGDSGVAVSFFGEGASNQGGVQETLNLAACWGLPVVFVCENSSPEVQRMLGHEIDYPQLSIERVSDRAPAYGMPGSSHEGWDVLKVYEAAGEAVTRARVGGGPTLLEFKVHQIEGNLEGRLEAKQEERVWCPIHNLRRKLLAEGLLTQEEDAKMREQESAALEEVVSFAVGSPEPELLEAFRDVFAEGG